MSSSCPKPHRRRDSGELDVFEATRYFSGGIDAGVGHQRAMKVERKSLDVPQLYYCQGGVMERHQAMKEKKCKQPSSPGGKLASFLSSLFQQSSSKKKASSKSLKGDPGQEHHGERKRRSSVGHCQSTRGGKESKSCYNYGGGTTASGLRTPSLYSYKSDGILEKSKAVGDYQLKRCGEGFVKKSDDEFILKGKKLGWRGEEEEEEEEDGGASDTSSDLFELKNFDLSSFSSGLPVYGSTNMEVIRKEANIASVAF